jgi:hypothetical protein
MNRFVRGAAAAVLAAGGLGSLGCMGGERYRNWVDPCWPERYNAAARDEVLDPFRKQVHNGQVLHHTIWNYYFVPGTDVLTPAGMEKLDSIAKERPAPDPKLFIQTARDIPVVPPAPAAAGAPGEPGNLDRIPALREELDGRRAAVVQKYMASQPTFTPVAYEIFVHDPVVTGIHSNFAGNAFRGQLQGYRGGLAGSGGGAVIGTGGGTMAGPPGGGMAGPPGGGTSAPPQY